MFKQFIRIKLEFKEKKKETKQFFIYCFLFLAESDSEC